MDFKTWGLSLPNWMSYDKNSNITQAIQQLIGITYLLKFQK